MAQTTYAKLAKSANATVADRLRSLRGEPQIYKSSRAASSSFKLEKRADALSQEGPDASVRSKPR
jgi:hypothetical protein